MPTITIEPTSLRSIIKWELGRAPRAMLLDAAGKKRTERDDALSALADLVAKRLSVYTITVEREGRGDASHLAVRPDYYGTG